MESSSFYITLPSNASMDFYVRNTASNYTIRMPRTFYLQGKYEVALAEIQYPHIWNSMKTYEDYYVCYRPNGEEEYKFELIPVGYYKSVTQLCEEINERIEIGSKRKRLVTLRYHESSRRVYIKTDGYEVTFSKPLAEVLGFIHSFREGVWFENQHVAQRNANLKQGFYTLYVYCSLCEAQVVGDYYVPLLRTVAIQGEDGDLVMKTYSEPHYVPVNTSKFDTIEINIKDDQGEDVAFESGKVICKLHFRQKGL